MTKKHETDWDIELLVQTYSMVRAIQISYRVTGAEAKEMLSAAMMDADNNIIEIISQHYDTRNKPKQNNGKD